MYTTLRTFFGIFCFWSSHKNYTISGDSIQFQARTVHTAFQSAAWEPDGSWTQSKPLCSVCKGPGWAATVPANERLTLLPYEMGIVCSATQLAMKIHQHFLSVTYPGFLICLVIFLSIDYLHYGLGNSCTDIYVEQQVSRSYCTLILNIVHIENSNAYDKMFS